jgi:hypothetical protein
MGILSYFGKQTYTLYVAYHSDYLWIKMIQNYGLD